jgi:ubiquinone/menaquinone biosynthesis C-methylase UbiE
MARHFCHICPWWIGYLLIVPWRKRVHDPHAILSPHVKEGMTVLEPGPGMGFFTLELASLVGSNGRVIAVDAQKRMLDALSKRARKAGLAERIETRLVSRDGMNIGDLENKVDFVLACYMVHELPDQNAFFRETYRALKSGGRLLLSEPKQHVAENAFQATVDAAKEAGFAPESTPEIKRSRSVVFLKK